MKKKGVAGLPWLIRIGLGLLVVFIVIFFIAGPDKLLAKTRDAGFFFGLGNIPGEERPELVEIALPAGLVEYFENLVATIDAHKDAERCLILPDEVPNIGDHRILLSPGRAQIIKLGRGGFSTTDNDIEIDGFTPCVVAWGGAENFYDNWLDGSIGSRTFEYYNNPNAMTLQLESGNELITPNEGDGRRYEILEEGGKLYIYKADDEHFCFISSHGGGDCELSDGKKSIEEGCVDKMPYFETGLLLCEDKAGETILPVNDAVEDAAERLARAISRGLDKDAERCIQRYILDVGLEDTELKIGLVQEGDTIKFYQVNSEGRVSLIELEEELQARLCLVEGDAARSLDTNIKRDPGTSLQTSEYVEKDRFAIKDVGSKIKIITGGEYDNNDDAYFNIDDRDYRYLYKADSEHICFLTLREDSGGTCFLNTQSSIARGIDDDCFKEWINEKKLLTCSEKEDNPFMQELVDNGYTREFIDSATEFSEAITKAAGSDKEVCRVELYEFKKYPGFDNQRVRMWVNGNNLQVQAEGRDREVVILQQVEDYVPCIIHGQNFWEWLWNADETARDNQHIDKQDVTIVGDDYRGVTFFPANPDGAIARDLTGGRPLIYKTGEGHICIIHTYEDGGNSCNKDTLADPDGLLIINGVDSDCIAIRDGNDWLEDIGRIPEC